MRRIRLLAFITLTAAAVAFPTRAAAQSIQDLVQSLGVQSLARDYLRPGADAVGYAINSGLYHTARIDKGFHFWIGVRGILTFVPEQDRTFDAVLPATLTDLGYPARITTATVFGAKGAMLTSTKKDPGGNPYPDIQLPGGADLHSTWLAVPHVVIGTVAATEIMVRGVPEMTVDTKIGRLSFWGVGISHSPTTYIHFPIDIAVMASMQKLKVGDLMSITTMNANIRGSVTSNALTVFAGAGYESYQIDVAYDYTPPAGTLPGPIAQPARIALDFRRRNLRFTVGAAMTLLPLVDITADYSFGIQDNFTIGTGISF